MTDTASLLETLELLCARCGRRGPDTFTDLRRQFWERLRPGGQ